MKKFAVIFAAVWVGFSLVLTGCGNKKEVETKAVHDVKCSNRNIIAVIYS